MKRRNLRTRSQVFEELRKECSTQKEYSRYKGPEVGVCLVCLWDSQKVWEGT